MAALEFSRSITPIKCWQKTPERFKLGLNLPSKPTSNLKGLTVKPLIVLEMANNHMGDVAHGQAIIRAFGTVTKDFTSDFDFAFKLQYRDLDTYIHSSYKGRADVRYIKRFEETRLTDEQFLALIKTMRQEGFKVICTPFDEPSVDKIEAQGIDVIKIASCSFTDWPLLERVMRTGKPVIASTAAAPIEEIDNVVSFFQHRNKPLTLMHCVGEYPTKPENLAIGQIALLKQRYPDVPIGFSTHEPPGNTDAVKIALALGSKVLEKHVGLPTERYPLNAYSCSPEQVRHWLESARMTLAMLGDPSKRYTPSEEERTGLFSLKRGIFAHKAVSAGKILSSDDVVFAFPTSPGQLTANDWSKYVQYKASIPIPAGAPILAKDTQTVHLREKVLSIVQSAKNMLKAGNIVVPGRSALEISHHYGLDKFDRFGMVLITVVNREYCKKLLVMLPGQTHPEQYHRLKEETFVVLHGEMDLKLNGVSSVVKAGDVITVERGVLHEFFTKSGVVFEEISSTHHTTDSYYTDSSIEANKDRKTRLSYWI
jgi:sialic acid synthase SpsE/quercetin dioxygenase-like cupin family protein